MIISRSIPMPDVVGRTLEGRAYSYGVPESVTDNGTEFYFEQVLPGADTKTIADRAGAAFPLLIWHSQTSNRGKLPADEIGEVQFMAGDTGLDYRAVLNRSTLADEMLDLVRDGTAEDVSVSYRPVRNIDSVHDGRPLVSRAEIAIRELSLCPTGTGQFAGAKVLVMRAGLAPEFDVDVSQRVRLLNLY